MRTRFFTLLPAFAAMIAMLLAPVSTARSQLMQGKLTIRDENRMGAEFDQIIRSMMPMVGDTYITDYHDEMVERVVKAKKPMPFRITSAVVRNSMLNAFAIPGGYIYTFTGLIQAVETESQLAAVIAHELAHVSQRHVAGRIEKQQRLALLGTAGALAGILIGMAGGGKAGQALAVGAQGAASQAMLKYSRDDEREADHVGLNAMVKAGYNPKGMPETFQIMLKNRWFSGGGEIPSYLTTHPGLNERIGYLRDRIERLPAAFSEREDDNTRLRRIQVLIRSKMDDATVALGHFNNLEAATMTAMDHVGRGIVLERLKRRDEAAAAFMTAAAMAADDALVAREVGIFHYKTGDRNQAFRHLHQAVIGNRRDALALFYLARLQADDGDYARAEKNMRLVASIVPEDAEVHRHLGRIVGESGDAFGGNLHLAYASVYSRNLRKARYHAGKAKTLAQTSAQKTELDVLNAVIKAREELGR